MASRLILKEFDEPQGGLTDNLKAMWSDLVERVSLCMPVFSGAWRISMVEFDEIGINKDPNTQLGMHAVASRQVLAPQFWPRKLSGLACPIVPPQDFLGPSYQSVIHLCLLSFPCRETGMNQHLESTPRGRWASLRGSVLI
jgi:hypothetical protein